MAVMMAVPGTVPGTGGGVPGLAYPGGQPPQGPATQLTVTARSTAVLAETYRSSR